MANEGVTNLFINNLLFKFSKTYKGCFSSDNFPKNLKPPFSIIINLSKHNKPGTHFICIIENKKQIFYFDSFGINCFVPSICNFLLSKQKEIVQNIKSIQHQNSLFCGFFCILFVLFMEKNKFDLTKFQNKFSTNLIKNDYACINEIKKYLIV